MTLWEAVNIGKRYRKSGKETVEALRAVDLCVEAGEILSLVGESGSGKSTLARLILGLEKPSDGYLRFRGKKYSEWGSMRHLYPNIQMVFQSTSESANPAWSAEKTIAEPLVHLTAMTASQRKMRVFEISEKVGFPAELLRTPMGSLSGGQRQRVCIARAMAVCPAFLVLDEPTSGLDIHLQDQLLSLLENLSRELAVSMFLITHDIKAAVRCAHRVAFLWQGAIVELRDATELHHLIHPYARKLYEASL